MPTKVKSFTLTELLVVMIITAIVVGIAFTVLRLVQKQVFIIGQNFEKSSTLSLFEQQLWQDFHTHRILKYDKVGKLLYCESEVDTVTYRFTENYLLRKTDTIKLNISVVEAFFKGKTPFGQYIDAIHLDAGHELPGYSIFTFKQNDDTLIMELDGL